MPEPISTPIDSSPDEINIDEGLTNIKKELDKPITRRSFLKLAFMVAGAAALTACDPNEVLSSEDPRLKENVNELNKQFEEIESQYLDENGNFNYELFKTHPEFERYLPEIHTNSEKLGKELKINPNALKLLSSAIVSANLGDWEKVNLNQTPYTVRDRVGPMRFYPSVGLETVKRKLKDDYNYTVQEIEGPFNIQIGLNHLVYGCLPEIDKSGENTNYFQLTLAQYMGGKDLVTHVKDNKEVAEGSFLRESYDLYTKTASAINHDYTHSTVEKSGIESNLDRIWNKATKEFWTDTNLEVAKKYFFEQAHKYATDEYNKILGLSEEEYLALFISISMAESHGGVYKGPNQISGARGWFQVVPDAHLWQYNEAARIEGRPEYDIHQLLDDPKASTEVGTWALMRYRNSQDFQNIKTLMKQFKAGRLFDTHWESGIWWNRVSYCMSHLMNADTLGLGYMDYEFPQGTRKSASEFLQNESHIGNVRIRGVS